ncbi:MAG TPA: DivIVA domain-containing protein [Candidatus Cloacimonadota bacterium]|jgi:DivIVA domain-containing protein|nr:DivIVA domain-containing protein [Candidatus Cloacimonadota bacterium]OQC11129.1 MAG: Septum site-determining protein DivIVA [Candidatus Cloacimonetes bacterium ADurb.Bin088]NMD13359.1 DivIVA domain-containing protein [Candidatus Cloacimonadota bacterium]HOC94752.1 DivIVA domain-containing protein [Candidatus Cloacimonadota bacterium]HOF59255.1 DivIVA domain-containing protein [Candidatus Cloacimonadota bacterium]
MSLYPTDIRHQEFSGTLFGFSKKEVREFLEQLATELEDYQRRQEKEIQRREVMQHEVKQEAIQASSAVEDLKRREELISRTLVFAEKTKADIIANARKEAENIIHEAELKAKRAIQEARQYLTALEHQYVQIKEQKRQFLMQFKSELQTFMDRIGKDPLLTKDTEQLLDTEFKQIKDEINPGNNPRPEGQN